MEWKEKYYEVNEIRMHVVEAGDPQGEVLLFLHGFPEFWWGWRHQIDFFAERGYFVVVPDQRGYNLSSKPKGKEAYRMVHLTDDIAALIHQLPAERVNLVGHDWGGAVAWAMALRFPQLLHKLIVLNLPHPKVMGQFLKRKPKQLLKSWYVGFFQLPWLPEQVLSGFNYAFIAQSMLRTSKRGTFDDKDMQHYKAAWAQPGALTAMIHWYRAALSGTLILQKQVSTPTLLIWGKKDQFLSHEMAQPSIAQCKYGQLEMVDDATHWVQHEKAALVNNRILKFVGKDDG